MDRDRDVRRRREKLEALANDPGATPAERAFAQRLLERMGDPADLGVRIAVSESWEMLLLHLLADRNGVAVTDDPEGIPQINGPSAGIDQVIDGLTLLHPLLENVVMSAAVGFLSAALPPETTGEVSSNEGFDVHVAAEAHRRGRVYAGPAPRPRAITQRGPKRLTGPVDES